MRDKKNPQNDKQYGTCSLKKETGRKEKITSQ
jgi:hypothetical protein